MAEKFLESEGKCHLWLDRAFLIVRKTPATDKELVGVAVFPFKDEMGNETNAMALVESRETFNKFMESRGLQGEKLTIREVRPDRVASLVEFLRARNKECRVVYINDKGEICSGPVTAPGSSVTAEEVI